MSTLTLAVPTHNRAATLRDTLASIADLDIPAGIDAECLVIDNRCSDETPALVDKFARTAPLRVRRVVEERLGSSFARNRAIDESRADFLLFIDDDAIADRRWALEMLSEMARRKLDAVCGMVLARWSVAPPRWLGPSLWVKLAVHDRDAIESAPLASVETHANYFSANAGFTRAALERYGKFREDLGVVGSNPISGEDTELFMRIVARGGRMGFASRAIVHHQIPPDRMTRQYLRRKSFAFGYGSAIAGGESHNHLDKFVRNALRMTLAAARGDRERAIFHELECANFIGYWRGRMVIRSGGR